eukprot:403338456
METKLFSDDSDPEPQEPVPAEYDIYTSMREAKPLQLRQKLIEEKQEQLKQIVKQQKVKKNFSLNLGKAFTNKFILNNDRIKKKNLELQQKSKEREEDDILDSQYKRFPELLPVDRTFYKNNEDKQLSVKINSLRDNILLNEHIQRESEKRTKEIMQQYERELKLKGNEFKNKFLTKIRGEGNVTFDYEGRPMFIKQPKLNSLSDQKQIKSNINDEAINKESTYTNQNQNDSRYQYKIVDSNNKITQVYNPNKEDSFNSDYVLNKMNKEFVTNTNNYQYALPYKNIKPTYGAIVRDNTHNKTVVGPETVDYLKEEEERIRKQNEPPQQASLKPINYEYSVRSLNRKNYALSQLNISRSNTNKEKTHRISRNQKQLNALLGEGSVGVKFNYEDSANTNDYSFMDITSRIDDNDMTQNAIDIHDLYQATL